MRTFNADWNSGNITRGTANFYLVGTRCCQHKDENENRTEVVGVHDTVRLGYEITRSPG